jgi:transcriptional regulator with XRE-family HTH domain
MTTTAEREAQVHLLHERVEDLMSQQHLNYQDLAAKSGLHVNTIRGLLSYLGKATHQIQVMARLSEALGQEPGWLLNELRERGLR